MKDQHVRITIRLPREVRDWLKQQAQRCNRSLNGQLVEEVRVRMQQASS